MRKRNLVECKPDFEGIDLSYHERAMQCPQYYDKAGNIIHMWQWARLKEDLLYSKVDCTTIKQNHHKRLVVSTVWRGLNHSFGDGPPLIFETMVFVRKDPHRILHIRFGGVHTTMRRTERIDYQRRYPTLEMAKVGHAMTIEYFKYNRKQRRRKNRAS